MEWSRMFVLDRDFGMSRPPSLRQDTKSEKTLNQPEGKSFRLAVVFRITVFFLFVKGQPWLKAANFYANFTGDDQNFLSTKS
jgi:hypothetical protein